MNWLYKSVTNQEWANLKGELLAGLAGMSLGCQSSRQVPSCPAKFHMRVTKQAGTGVNTYLCSTRKVQLSRHLPPLCPTQWVSTQQTQPAPSETDLYHAGGNITPFVDHLTIHNISGFNYRGSHFSAADEDWHWQEHILRNEQLVDI